MFRLLVLISVVACALGAVVPSGLVPMLDGRIVGGVETTIEEFPHQISLKYYGSHRCGGSVTSENVVVTAAHCVHGISASSLQIQAGSTSKSGGGVTIQVKEIRQHEGYNPSIIHNDIAVLVLETPLEFSDSIQPVGIPGNDEELEEGTAVFVSGWGALREGGSSPDVLQYVEVATICNEKCAKAYGKVGAEITESMLCAAVPAGGKDACQGDSGGPLIAGNKLHGVVSWGYGCARKDYPGVYAKVTNLRSWLDQNLP